MSDAAPIPTEEQRARAVFARLGERYGSRAQTAIRFALANPGIACVLVGMAELGHLEEALAAAALGPLPDEALARARELYAAGLRARLTCRLTTCRNPRATRCAAWSAARRAGSRS